MNSSEAWITARLARYPNLPIKKKLELVTKMSEEYQIIGLIIAAIDDEFLRKVSHPMYIRAADKILAWAAFEKSLKK